MSENFLATDLRGFTRIRQIRLIVTPVTATEFGMGIQFSACMVSGNSRELSVSGLQLMITGRIAVWNERDTKCI